jgi:DNA-binding transcriptional MocR family regulator
VQGRQSLGQGWVSHLLQELVAALWSDPATLKRLRRATAHYTERREALVEALRRQGVAAHGRSGMNVWVPVAEEAATIARLAAAGWAVRAGERYRLKSGPAIRITVSRLEKDDVARVAAAVAAAVRPPAARTA